MNWNYKIRVEETPLFHIEIIERVEMADRKETANRRNEQIDRKSRKGKKNAKPLLLLLIACILGITAIFAFNTKLKIQHYSLESEKLTAPVRIVLITDLHSCSYGEG